MPKKIFVNLPVKSLERSRAFFAALGFEFDPDYSDENAACLILGEQIYAMLITAEAFKKFTRKPVADAELSTETINALLVDSRERVEELRDLALEAGGRLHRDPDDYGWMFSQSIEDPDGHIWEFFTIDEEARRAALGGG